MAGCQKSIVNAVYIKCYLHNPTYYVDSFSGIIALLLIFLNTLPCPLSVGITFCRSPLYTRLL